ncbi:glycosyltransferase family 4 protein [Mucilaginibacter robiniae]|uniref:Glycosyltransferase family 4 protein n=1 Tax=Mucilaginibacter robiniae TaxID=2728022 RepID=A0A7L5E314_9SPHI|nr:glycosyltransferase family 4 protein [Mucilaginibacter robiniae]QJD96948.1 glycosyltransferase family 4 protein [Mucilaginibacter robiniae]
MKIAVASLGDPRSVKTWSGIPAHIIKALENRGHQIVAISLRKPAEPWYYNWLRRYYYNTQKKWFMAFVEKKVLQAIGQQFDQEVNQANPDVVLAIHADFLAYTTFKQPSVSIHDTTFASLLGYYKDFSSLTRRSIKAGNDMYQKALNKVDAAVFSATWASNSALNDYQVRASKIHTIPLGANLDHAPAMQDVQAWINRRADDEICRFLFLGVVWERKGGPDAVKFVAELNRLGIKSNLTVVGCKADVPAEYQQYVIQAGFLRKDVPAEAEKLNNLFQQSHALLLPSVAECYGCVYCEANAYGTPAIGRDTGGIPEIIKDGVNGLLMQVGETPQSLASRWVAIWRSKEAYQNISLSARAEFDNRLNYDVFCDQLETVINSVQSLVSTTSFK